MGRIIMYVLYDLFNVLDSIWSRYKRLLFYYIGGLA